MHFKDKEALLAGVAEAGFVQLTEALDQSVKRNSALPWKERYHGGCFCYVHHAIENKGYVQAMFRRYDPERFPELFSISTGSIQSLIDILVEGQQGGYVRKGDIQSMVGATWTLLHGVAMLLMYRDDIPSVLGEQQIEPLVETLLTQLLDGLKA